MSYVITKAAAGDAYLMSAESRGKYRKGIDAKKIATASIACPECGKVCSLTNHKIDADGKVSPSVVCPGDGCSFHEHIILDGWKRIPKPGKKVETVEAAPVEKATSDG